MNQTAIIVIVLVAAAAIGLVAWGYGRMAGPTQAQLDGPGSLTASQTPYDFGTISMANGKVDHVFQIANPTAGDVTISNIQTSCMCTTAYLMNGGDREGPFGMPGMGYVNAASAVVPAHGTQDIDVVFDPAAHGPAGIGNVDRFIDIIQADGNKLQLEIRAIVAP